MSKRCCAQHCFNSTLYTKNISYFSFPKNKTFADQWADLAGRSDLKTKPLSRIIKYFLCSEHFAANCFNDKETKQVLKRDLPRSIALPSIFKNNLQETMQISNPKQSMEVHNIVLLQIDNDTKTKTSSSQNDEIDLDFDFEKQVEEIENFDMIAQKESAELEKDQQQDELGDPLNTIDDTIYHCRLCFKELKDDEPMMPFEDSLHLQEFISRVMSDKITLGDEYSQIVCKNCENNCLLCLIIIQQMDATQDKIISSNEEFT